MRRAAPIVKALFPTALPRAFLHAPLTRMAPRAVTTVTACRSMSVMPRFIISNVTPEEYTREANVVLANIVVRYLLSSHFFRFFKAPFLLHPYTRRVSLYVNGISPYPSLLFLVLTFFSF